MQVALLLVHVALAVALIALVLLQQGKGAEAGAAFGGGASQTVFGSRGSTSFFAKLTGGLAALFFATSLGLAWYADQGGSAQGSGIPDASVIEQQQTGIPSLDDAGSDNANGARSGSSDQRGDAAALSVPNSAESNPVSNESAPTLDSGADNQDNTAPAIEDGSADQSTQ